MKKFRNTSLFDKLMSALQDHKGNFEQKGIGPNSGTHEENMDEGGDNEEDMSGDSSVPTDTGAQLGNGMRAMHNLKSKLAAEEENETPADEESESPMEQHLEDKMGIEKHSAGKHLFPKGKGLHALVMIAHARKKMR